MTVPAVQFESMGNRPYSVIRAELRQLAMTALDRYPEPITVDMTVAERTVLRVWLVAEVTRVTPADSDSRHIAWACTDIIEARLTLLRNPR